MNDTTVKNQLNSLKKKLESSALTRASLEKEIEAQSNLISGFISNLSLVCRGMDLELDNRLAELRSLLGKKPSVDRLEPVVVKTNNSLNRFANKNEVNLKKAHDMLLSSGKSLQALSGLPNQLRRDLRELLSKHESPLDAIPLYVPELLSLLSLYNNLVSTQLPKSGVNSKEVNRQYNNFQKQAQVEAPTLTSSDNCESVKAEYIDKFSLILSEIVIAKKQEKQLNAIKRSLKRDISATEFISTVISTFELIISNLKDERATAENFLYSLNDALSSVQTAVKNTLESTDTDAEQHNSINSQLKRQLSDMTNVVDSATSLEQLKTDINGKLSFIVESLDKKSSLELQQKQKLQQELAQMLNKIESLEKQSVDYEQMLQEQKQKSMQDSLTKLPNRAAFDEYLSSALSKWQSNPSELAVVVLDLDHFKRINDTYGHTAGDKTLQVIASAINKFADKDTFVARFGGEEFVIVLSNLNKAAAVARLEKLRKSVAKLPFKFRQQNVSITISIGVTHVKSGDNMHIAFERADSALYEAKNQGRNRVIYSE